MRRVIAAALAGGLLVVGALAAASVTGGEALAQTADSLEAQAEGEKRPGRGEVLAAVLGDLVVDGTITQAQADAISEALTATFEELKDEFPHRGNRGFRRGFRWGTLLDDGVINADELAELPDDHPLKDPDGPAAPYIADDGQLDREELEELREQRRAEREARAEGTNT